MFQSISKWAAVCLLGLGIGIGTAYAMDIIIFHGEAYGCDNMCEVTEDGNQLQDCCGGSLHIL
jgi:hypothetical protein